MAKKILKIWNIYYYCDFAAGGTLYFLIEFQSQIIRNFESFVRQRIKKIFKILSEAAVKERAKENHENSKRCQLCNTILTSKVLNGNGNWDMQFVIE